MPAHEAGVPPKVCPLLGRQAFSQASGPWAFENNTDRNLKDLEEVLGNTKALMRIDWESKGIPIGPSMAPRFFSTEIPSRAVPTARKLMPVSGANLVARMAHRDPASTSNPST